ncbi:MAG: helix-turn-helix domain-containing protein [Bacillaceae bacterium]|nr:helix-turn-helix domain-containing protein [Bacillaceae bacterium]
MYVSVKEIAEYLHLSPDYVLQQIQLGNIKAVHDGHSFYVNKQQFIESKENIEKEILRWKEQQIEEIPEDIDVKDED